MVRIAGIEPASASKPPTEMRLPSILILLYNSTIHRQWRFKMAHTAKARSAKHRAKRKAAGICADCPAPAHNGTTRCVACAARNSTCSGERYAKRKAAGLCDECDKPASKGKTKCPACLSKRAANTARHRAKRKAAGLCTKCGKRPPRTGYDYCAPCADKESASKAKRFADLRAAATTDMYIAQGKKCAGCQHPFPQRCLTIDHIIPRANGGDDAPTNLQLLCHYCNSVKRNKTQADLLARLREHGIIDAAGNNIEVEYGTG